MKTAKFTAAILLALAFCSTASSIVFAQSPAPPAAAPQPKPQLDIRELKPDASKNEESHLQVWLNGILVEETINYKDGQIKITDYRDDGTLHGTVELSDQGKKLTITKYLKDGKGKESMSEVALGGKLNRDTKYHDDGKTPHVVTDLHGPGDADDEVTYYGKDGLPTSKLQNRGLNMELTAYDKAGKLSHKQVWVSGIAGYVLLSVEEITPTGVYRRVHFRGGAKQVDYLKPDGTVERTESIDKGSLELAEPVAPEHLKKIELK